MKFEGGRLLKKNDTRVLLCITEFARCSIIWFSVKALLRFNYNNCYANAPQCYVTRTLPILLYVYLLDFSSNYHLYSYESIAETENGFQFIAMSLSTEPP